MFIKPALAISVFITLLWSNCALAITPINAEANAYAHNNKGLQYLKENYYYGAIKEFQIAIDLAPKTQATSIYYYNLANTFDKIGYPELARPCYEQAVTLNALYFDYYLQLAKNYKKLGIINKEIEKLKGKRYSPLNNVLIGLLYIQNGHITTGITILDDFCDKEPNLIITKGVKEYLKNLTKEKL